MRLAVVRQRWRRRGPSIISTCDYCQQFQNSQYEIKHGKDSPSHIRATADTLGLCIRAYVQRPTILEDSGRGAKDAIEKETIRILSRDIDDGRGIGAASGTCCCLQPSPQNEGPLHLVRIWPYLLLQHWNPQVPL
ncbi:hypothetical protein FGO68_gene12221 [Halteria grandinella]|uniref:Uncharacterized protein n=1 Tax=Halteria grandinella TaxID=5974 RepID=A0A8J8NFE8_HALGN|nr:hypothetical protein FGO68_gene12221 [Halteria grandinella]